MTCGLNDNELSLLFHLYNNRNLKMDKAQHIEKIRNYFQGRIDVDKNIRSLLNKGYLGCVHKGRGEKYYCQAGITIRALASHGYPISRGGKVPLV